MPHPRFKIGATKEEIDRAHRHDQIEDYVIIALLLGFLIALFGPWWG